MSALCQKRAKCGASKSFDHIISEREQLVRSIEADHFCSFAVDDQLVTCLAVRSEYQQDLYPSESYRLKMGQADIG
jgi:hypothetical protein